MFGLGSYTLLVYSLAAGVIVGFIGIIRIRVMKMPKLVPAIIMPYSSAVSSFVVPEVKTEVSKFSGWEPRPQECSYSEGYLATLQNNQFGNGDNIICCNFRVPWISEN